MRNGEAQTYADVPNRVIALFFDAVLLALLIFLEIAVVGLLIGPTVSFNSDAEALGEAVTIDGARAIIDSVVSLLTSAAYFILSWRAVGRSPGQYLLGMTVVRHADGDRPSFKQAAVRWLLFGGPFSIGAVLVTAAGGVPHVALVTYTLIVAWYVVLLVTTARSTQKQGLHDRAAHTIVSKAARAIPWETWRLDAR